MARQILDDLQLACSEIDNVELYEYNLSVTLKKIELPKNDTKVVIVL